MFLSCVESLGSFLVFLVVLKVLRLDPSKLKIIQARLEVYSRVNV